MKMYFFYYICRFRITRCPIKLHVLALKDIFCVSGFDVARERKYIIYTGEGGLRDMLS